MIKDCHVYGFYTVSKNALSAAILLKEYGRISFDGTIFSHCGNILVPKRELITPDSLVVEATLKHGGVKFTTLKTVIARSAHCIVTEHDAPISLDQFFTMFDTAKRIEGAGYDLKGVLGLGVGENWQETDKFYCSESKGFIMKSGYYDGVDWRRYEKTGITPKDCLTWPQRRINLGFV